MQIEISDSTYKRLEKLVEGFDTPDAVISRLLDSVEGAVESKPEIIFYPSDEEHFKRLLLRDQLAEVAIYKSDMTREVSQWVAKRLTESSNLKANLWSGYLRDWKKKGITKIELSIYPKPTHIDDTLEFERDKKLALTLGLTFNEMRELDGDYEIDTNESNDGLVYEYIVRFHDSCDSSILSKIDGLENNCISLPSYTFE
ncbi:TPA: hypothetical protein JG805_003781 [Vibrio parahaemolyticus]|nr:hypothetical protein [Vibrio parahaemolyticus]